MYPSKLCPHNMSMYMKTPLYWLSAICIIMLTNDLYFMHVSSFVS